MDRTTVYKLIDGERRYQAGASICGDRPHTVGEWVLLLEHYAHKARKDWCENGGDEAALDEIRKLAAVAVACMEQHGAPARTTHPAC